MTDARTVDGRPLVRGADDIARALNLRHLPTEEQRAVIEAPLAPTLVVAGAGSGKTETMAARVVWLVANGMVSPDEVLGLTFTRKAASELSARITSRLTTLRDTGLWTPRVVEGAEVLGAVPVVSTYHAYAGGLVREHGLRLGHEPSARLLTEASAWQLAHDVIMSWDGPTDDFVRAEATLTGVVLDLAGEMAEHLVTPGEVADHLDAVMAALTGLPVTGRGTSFPAALRDLIGVLRERRALMPVVEQFQAAKRSADTMDFADQMAIAARLATAFPDVGAIERDRFRVILLDEFQDTSEAQLRLLRALFVTPDVPSPVTAVGDPHQSIYGWRGASAAALGAFVTHFGGAHGATVLPLTTSWRNDAAVLAAANVVAEPLTAASTVDVRSLTARPDAGPGTVWSARLETQVDEADHVATWLADRGAGREDRSAAVLCRKRSQFGPVIAALERAGLPFEVIGLGGLLLTPEVEDLVALLHVVADPSRGDQLMRLLTGPPVHLGAGDLDGLWTWADRRQRSRLPEHRDRSRLADQEPEAVDDASLAEALEKLPPPGWIGPDGQHISPEARRRLAALAGIIARTRRTVGLGLAELVATAERALGLDIEVLARPGRGPVTARAHLDAFADVAATFSATAERPTLGAFLAWLEAAVEKERGLDKGNERSLDGSATEAANGVVQIMTVHAAKGLEWDIVAIPGLVESTFPDHTSNQTTVRGGEWDIGTPKDKGWLASLTAGGIPYDLRGDRSALPHFPWRTVPGTREAVAALEEFAVAGGEHGITEERRLMYVAITRARRHVLLSCSIWSTASTVRRTSRFLDELVAAHVVTHPGPWLPLPPGDPVPVRPEPVGAAVPSWPQQSGPDPAQVAAAADVRVALMALDDDGDPRFAADSDSDGPGHRREIDILLAELAEDRAGHEAVAVLPDHLSTSAMVALAADPEAFAAELRRPMPRRPALAARRGTAFHAWVEEHFARAAFVDVDELPGSADDDAVPIADLTVLKENFLASDWADRIPDEIEIAIETVIDGVAIRGRIDAVFQRDDGGWTVVDWKTGRPPTGERARVRSLQLAAYRLAWARLRGIPEEQVDAAFYYASTGDTVRPELPGLDEIVAVLSVADR